jgi:hypothetical protein
MIQPNPRSSVDTFRKDEAGNLVPITVELPEVLDISFGEYRDLMPLLGRGEAQIGDLLAIPLLNDGLVQRPSWIVPGFYAVAPDITYLRHRPSPPGLNYLLEDYEAAKITTRRSRGQMHWQGRAFPLLQAGMAHPDSVGQVVFFTARHHEQREYMGWIEAMQRDGFIKNAVGRGPRGETTQPRFHSLHDPQSLVFGRHVAQKKASVVHQEAQQLLRSSSPLHSEIVPDGVRAVTGEREPMHLLLAAEDCPMNLAAIIDRMETLSEDNQFSHRIKFVVLNAAPEHELARSRYPYRYTVFDRGFGRPALPQEIAEWTDPNGATWRSQRHSGATCAKLF